MAGRVTRRRSAHRRDASIWRQRSRRFSANYGSACLAAARESSRTERCEPGAGLERLALGHIQRQDRDEEGRRLGQISAQRR